MNKEVRFYDLLGRRVHELINQNDKEFIYIASYESLGRILGEDLVKQLKFDLTKLHNIKRFANHVASVITNACLRDENWQELRTSLMEEK